MNFLTGSYSPSSLWGWGIHFHGGTNQSGAAANSTAAAGPIKALYLALLREAQELWWQLLAQHLPSHPSQVDFPHSRAVSQTLDCSVSSHTQTAPACLERTCFWKKLHVVAQTSKVCQTEIKHRKLCLSARFICNWHFPTISDLFRLELITEGKKEEEEVHKTQREKILQTFS